MDKQTKPAPLYAWLAAGVLMVGAILGFALLVRADLQRARPVDVSEYTEAVPDTLVWSLTQRWGENYLAVDGYVYLSGEKSGWVENAVVLCDGERYLQLATAMVRREELSAEADGLDHRTGGLTAFVWEKELTAEASGYELCILYGADHHRILVHTGQMLEGRPAV